VSIDFRSWKSLTRLILYMIKMPRTTMTKLSLIDRFHTHAWAKTGHLESMHAWTIIGVWWYRLIVALLKYMKVPPLILLTSPAHYPFSIARYFPFSLLFPHLPARSRSYEIATAFLPTCSCNEIEMSCQRQNSVN